MKQKAIQELYQEEENFFWHQSRRLLIYKLLRHFLGYSSERQILDVGCGTGGNLKVLKKFGKVSGLDFSEAALNFCRQRGGFSELYQARGENTGLADASFDLVCAFDVLEHIQDDRGALREWGRVLKRGGWLFITVPAYQWLFSEHDKSLGHFRRYSQSELRQKVEAAGFKTVWLSYFLFLLFPLALLQRFLSRLRPRSGYPRFPFWLNRLLTAITALEVGFLPQFHLPGGLSVVLLARKPE